ncbi:hypothetical protein BCY91_12635 [Pelobium manganitolerans]|uniref:Thioredoxin domain-containing protein n=1 Tax=Pelobium manganitolerans TaxID=1842495 RepID=A0A419S1W5_9SPHI|nr:TlpA disulfide reductase family protein [Pelobium manganitolerans]RKD12484.1 hypothetical protein BCY91_12635 [Pelobium manganitolerans]
MTAISKNVQFINKEELQIKDRTPQRTPPPFPANSALAVALAFKNFLHCPCSNRRSGEFLDTFCGKKYLGLRGYERKNKNESQTYRKVAIVIILNVFITLSAFSQTAINLNDTVPNIPFHHLLNYSDSNAKLNDFRGKMVILDFWATWCKSCLNHLPDAEQLQKTFGNKIQFILVNSYSVRETPEHVGAFLKNWEKSHIKLSVPIARGDTVTRKIFPRMFLPHYVWIDQNGIYRAATSHHEVTEENVRNAIEGNYPTIFKKQ